MIGSCRIALYQLLLWLFAGCKRTLNRIIGQRHRLQASMREYLMSNPDQGGQQNQGGQQDQKPDQQQQNPGQGGQQQGDQKPGQQEQQK